MARVPNYNYPLESERTLQWTKMHVPTPGSRPPVRLAGPKKKVIQMVVKEKMGAKKQVKKWPSRTRKGMWNQNGVAPKDPMKAPNPVPGNGTHVSNTPGMYRDWQA